MRFQDYISEEIKKTTAEAFKNAKAVPADKLEWKPLDLGRSVLDQLQELAQSPDYVASMIAGEKQEEPNPDQWQQLLEQRQNWKTIEDCERESKARLEKLVSAIQNCSDARLKETVWLPYDGGRDFTIEEIMDYPRWNATYHLGQICYIQTLYGDREMH